MRYNAQVLASMWDCPKCGRTSALGIKKCRGCGYIYLSDEIAAHEAKEKRKRKPATPTPADNDSFLQSTLAFKDKTRQAQQETENAKRKNRG